MPEWDRALFDQFYSSKGEPWGRPNTRPGIRLHYHDRSVGQYQAFKYAPMLAGLIGLNPGDNVVLVGCGFNWTAEGLEALGAEVIGLDVSAYIQGQKGNTEEAEIRDAIVAAGLDPDTYVTPDHPALDAFNAGGGGTARNKNLLDIYLRGGRAAPVARGHGLIADEDMSNNGSRNRIRNALNSNPRFVISEEMINSISDSEIISALTRTDQFVTDKAPGATILHMVSPAQFYETGHPLEGQQNKGQVESAAAGLNWKSYAEWRTFLDANGFTTHGIIPTVTYGSVTAYGSIL